MDCSALGPLPGERAAHPPTSWGWASTRAIDERDRGREAQAIAAVTPRSALVTGATSGLGLEAAAQLAERGWDRVLITGRTAGKVEAARRSLVERTGREAFETLVLDLGDPASVRRATGEVVERGGRIDLLLLNAGMVSSRETTRTVDGIEMTFASSLIGHHRLTMGLLAADLPAPEARIVIAGSEAARGDLPTFSPVDLRALAEDAFAGDLRAAAVALIRHDGPSTFEPNTAYATAKLFVAYWAAALARRLPPGMAVSAVSPGNVPGTGASGNSTAFVRRIVVPALERAPRWLGLTWSLDEGVGRYLEVAGMGPEVSGRFFASPPRRMVGPRQRVVLPHVMDEACQEAAWAAIVEVAGVGLADRD